MGLPVLAAAVLAGLVGDGSLGESPINATDDVAGNAAEDIIFAGTEILRYLNV